MRNVVFWLKIKFTENCILILAAAASSTGVWQKDKKINNREFNLQAPPTGFYAWRRSIFFLLVDTPYLFVLSALAGRWHRRQHRRQSLHDNGRRRRPGIEDLAGGGVEGIAGRGVGRKGRKEGVGNLALKAFSATEEEQLLSYLIMLS